jgi:hypothetical protein
MPELGALEPGQAASLAGQVSQAKSRKPSLAGLAPVARQSGRWTGRAFIRGGRANVRQAVTMPALVATRFNPDMKAKYKQRINAGKPAKVALTAVMRKLILLANALLKANRTWAPKTRLINTDTLDVNCRALRADRGAALSCGYFSACAGMTPVAKATAAAWVRFMQCNLWRAASRCVFTLPNAKPRISAIS